MAKTSLHTHTAVARLPGVSYAFLCYMLLRTNIMYIVCQEAASMSLPYRSTGEATTRPAYSLQCATSWKGETGGGGSYASQCGLVTLTQMLRWTGGGLLYAAVVAGSTDQYTPGQPSQAGRLPGTSQAYSRPTGRPGLTYTLTVGNQLVHCSTGCCCSMFIWPHTTPCHTRPHRNTVTLTQRLPSTGNLTDIHRAALILHTSILVV